MRNKVVFRKYTIFYLLCFAFLIFSISFLKLPVSGLAQVYKKDQYEPDNMAADAKRIVLSLPQNHTLYAQNDNTDWIFFFAETDINYKIMTGYDHRIKYTILDGDGELLFDTNGELLFDPNIEYSSFSFNENGYYSLKIEPHDPNNANIINYSITVIEIGGPSPTAYVLGRVVDENKLGIQNVDVHIGKEVTTTLSLNNVRGIDPQLLHGWFFMANLLAPASYSVYVTPQNVETPVLSRPFKISVSTYNLHQLGEIVINSTLLSTIRSIERFKNEGLSLQDRLKTSVVDDGVIFFEHTYTYWQNNLLKSSYSFLGRDDDSDGFTNIEEFVYNTDPGVKDDFPPILTPVVNFPVNGGIVSKKKPTLSVYNPRYGYSVKEGLSYVFELYAGISDLYAEVNRIDYSEVLQVDPFTSWEVNNELEDKRAYYWRVKAKTTDGKYSSNWMPAAMFFIEVDSNETIADTQISSLFFISDPKSDLDDPNSITISVSDNKSPINGASVKVNIKEMPDVCLVTINSILNPPALPKNILRVGDVIGFETSEELVSGNVYVEIPFSQQDLDKAGIKDLSELNIFIYNIISCGWEKMPEEDIINIDLDPNESVLVINPGHLSMFTLGKELYPDDKRGNGGGGCFIGYLNYLSYE